MNYRLILSIAVCLGLQSLNSFAQASIVELSMSDVVDAAVAQARVQTSRAGLEVQESSWLAAAPKLGVSYLKTREPLGTDETEVSLVLPLKSTRLRRTDAELQKISIQIVQAYDVRTRWFYSGVLRETLWAHRLARHKLESAQEKLKLLRKLEQQQQDLAAARVSSDLALLLVRQERVQAEVAELEYSQMTQRHLGRYRQLTGLQQLPVTITEGSISGAGSYQQHPMVRLLDLDHEREKELLASTSRRAEPWNVSLDAKQLDAPGLDEEQLGVSLEMPLSFLSRESQAHLSSSLQQSQTYWQARDELMEQLQRQRNKLTNEAALLQNKQRLLDESVSLSKALAERAAELRSASEINEEFALRRLLAVTDARANAALNRLLIEQNKALLNQAMGNSL